MTKLLSGWGGHMMPALGVPVPTVVVNRAVVDYPYLLSVAGSTHHFIKVQPDVLVQLTNATIVGSAAE